MPVQMLSITYRNIIGFHRRLYYPRHCRCSQVYHLAVISITYVLLELDLRLCRTTTASIFNCLRVLVCFIWYWNCTMLVYQDWQIPTFLLFEFADIDTALRYIPAVRVFRIKTCILSSKEYYFILREGSRGGYCFAYVLLMIEINDKLFYTKSAKLFFEYHSIRNFRY